jgi:purine-binding chemotaxis protein CheW
VSPHVRLRLGGESYALPISGVREVVDFGDVTPLPGAPRTVVGIRNVHGNVIPVIDLAGVLGLHVDERPAQILIVEDAERVAGLAVDGVTGVEVISDSIREIESPRLTGAVLLDGALVGVIDLQAVLAAVENERSG